MDTDTTLTLTSFAYVETLRFLCEQNKIHYTLSFPSKHNPYGWDIAFQTKEDLEKIRTLAGK